jgi:hypothetical protein
MGNGGKKRVSTKTMAGLAAIAVLAAIVGLSLASVTQIIGGTPESIVPTNVAATNPITMDVYTADQVTLLQGGITAGAGGKANFVDPNYSPIQAVCSDTWISDPAGAEVASGPVAPLWLDASYTRVTDDVTGETITFQMRYHYVVYMTVEVVLRTGPANPPRGPAPATYISPCGADLYGRPGEFPFNSEYRGALTRWDYLVKNMPPGTTQTRFKTNTMTGPRFNGQPAIGVQDPFARITTSFLQYSNLADMYVLSETSSVLDYPATVSRLKGVAPALPVHVDATVHVVGNTGRILGQNASFAYTLANGTAATATMKTKSAIVGFGMVGGMRETGTYTGIIPNVNPDHVPPYYDITDPAFFNDGGRKPDTDEFEAGAATTPLEGGSGPLPLEGWIRIKNLAPAVILDPLATIGPVGTYPTPDIIMQRLDINCNLPDTLDVAVSADMGAKLTAHVATAQLMSTMAWSDGPGSQWFETIDPEYIQWAYGMQVDNMMLAQNYTFPVDIVSERNVQLFSSDGHPIDLSTVVETDANALFMDPRVDQLYVCDYTPFGNPPPASCPFNIMDIPGWIACVVAKYAAWIVAALVIVVAIAGLYVYAKLKGAFRGN